jgi:hypothetical protein
MLAGFGLITRAECIFLRTLVRGRGSKTYNPILQLSNFSCICSQTFHLHELAGDFVRMNDLQEGDFIVIYSDVKSGKYVMFT